MAIVSSFLLRTAKHQTHNLWTTFRGSPHDALLALFSSEEGPATEEMLADEGLTQPDAGDHEALASWDAQVQGRTTASWLTMLSLAWDDRQL